MKNMLVPLRKKLSAENSDMINVMIVMEKLLHWAAIIESSDDAIISKSVDGYITSWNPGAERLYGYTASEIIGQPVSVLMPPAKQDDFPFIMKQLHLGKRIEHYETERLSKAGKIIHVSITVSPIRDSHGTIIGASKIARDITEKVEQAQRREEFTSTASHELKTPITSQKAFGELLERLIDKNGYDELKPYIRKINKQTKRLTKLIEDLLALSRIESGRLFIENEPFKLDKLLNETVEDMQMISSHTLLIKENVKQVVKGDRERIGQVVTNLLSNAIKYSPKASTITIYSVLKPDKVIVAVRDLGIGIDAQYHRKIFERFFRAVGEGEKSYPGMGIGLHLCQQIIMHHGGKIWVESEKGKGSTFYFTLPVTESDLM